MKKTCLLSLVCLMLGIGNAWATTGTTNPSLFTDPVDWCVQYGCANNNAAIASPDGWTSVAGNTGVVGVEGLQSFYNLQQGVTWYGDFPTGMGLIYNGGSFGNTPPDDIAAEFNEPLYGVGAYIQSNYYGAFTATIDLFDINDDLLGSYITTGVASGTPGADLFIGAYDASADVYAVTFDAVGIGPNEPDFSIGTMYLATAAPATTPEPSTMLLLGPSMLGLLGFARRRKALKSKEV